ncbi:MAG: metallophosphoesterase [Synergistaceae bacterium]|jgi:predicted phosphodiesterase|nr:metallophosphoesterase [Synergistaceae bacterium]
MAQSKLTPLTAFLRLLPRLALILLLLLAPSADGSEGAVPPEENWNRENLARIAALAPSSNTGFSFVVVGDTQGPNSKFPMVLSAILKEEGILFVFDLGDLVNYATDEEYEETFFRHVRGLDVPFLTCASNHDHFKSKRAANYSRLFGTPHYYSFSVANAAFIVLDNGQDYSMTEEQFLWLERELAVAAEKPVRFVMMHRPISDPRPSRKGTVVPKRKPHDMTENGRTQDAARLSALLDEWGVTMVFAGHIHSYYRGTWGRTPYIITGGGGGGLHDSGTEASFHHYVRVDVPPDGRVTYKVVPVRKMVAPQIALNR